MRPTPVATPGATGLPSAGARWDVRVPIDAGQDVPVSRRTGRPGATAGKSLACEISVPAGSAPAPLVILNHGSPGYDPAALGRMVPSDYDAPRDWFLAHGFAVAVPMRRGYGTSSGPYAELTPAQGDQYRYAAASAAAAADIRAVIDWIRAGAHSRIDAREVLLVGHSAGAMASLALAADGLPGLRAVINFAGGRGARLADGQNRRVVRPGELTACFRDYGRKISVPTLWIYGGADAYFPPPVSRELFGAFRRPGRDELVMLPGFGHALIHYRLQAWGPVVERFAGRIGIATGG